MQQSAKRNTLRWGGIGIFIPLALLGAWSALAQPKTAKAQKPQTASEKFKNIKVLKNLPADQLIPYMHKYNDSLGVKCTFCHVVNADHSGFDKDDKPQKNKAREMILMTIDINKRYKTVGKQATCFTCHHGHPEPEAAPPAAAP